MKRFCIGFIFFVQVFFSYPAVRHFQSFPPIKWQLENLPYPIWQTVAALHLTAWIISIVIALFCIYKFKLIKSLDKKNIGLDWMMIACIVIFITPILLLVIDKVWQSENLIVPTLAYFADNIIAPAILLIGFIKVMSTLKPQEAA